MRPDEPAGLAPGRVPFAEILGHTLANITPSAMATVTVSLVAAEGGLWTWAVYLAVGLLMGLVALQVAALARAVPAAGSLFVSIGTTLHPLAGVVSGWSMLGGYLGALLAAPILAGLFLSEGLRVWGVSCPWPLPAVACALAAWRLTLRDVEVAARASLAIEAVSLLIILAIAMVTLSRVGASDPRQWQAAFSLGPFFRAMTLSVLAYGGFETAANFGREGRAPRRTIPRAIIAAVVFSLGFYVFMAYAEMAGFGNDPALLARTEAPLGVLALRAGDPLLAVFSDLAMAIAAFSAAIATLNSLSRLLYSMGRHRVLPARLGTIGRHGTPAVALNGLGAASCAFAGLAGALAWSPLAIVGVFGVFTALGFIVIYVLAALAVFGWRRRRGLRPSAATWAALVFAVPLLATVFGENLWGARGAMAFSAYAFLAYVAMGIALARRSGAALIAFGPRHDD